MGICYSGCKKSIILNNFEASSQQIIIDQTRKTNDKRNQNFEREPIPEKIIFPPKRPTQIMMPSRNNSQLIQEKILDKNIINEENINFEQSPENQNIIKSIPQQKNRQNWFLQCYMEEIKFQNVDSSQKKTKQSKKFQNKNEYQTQNYYLSTQKYCQNRCISMQQICQANKPFKGILKNSLISVYSVPSMCSSSKSERKRQVRFTKGTKFHRGQKIKQINELNLISSQCPKNMRVPKELKYLNYLF